MDWQDILYYAIAALLVIVSAVSGALSTYFKNKANKTELSEEEGYQQAIDDAITSAEALGVSGTLKLNYAKLQVKLYVLSCKELEKTDDEIVADIEARIAVTNAVNVNKSTDTVKANGEDSGESGDTGSTASTLSAGASTIKVQSFRKDS